MNWSVPTCTREIIETHLSLLGSPLAICVSVVDQLIAACISYFGGGVGQSAFGFPLDLIAG